MKHFKILYHALLENNIYSGPSGYEVGFMSEAHTQEDIEKRLKLLKLLSKNYNYFRTTL